SGRGVGIDVAMTRIRALGGSLDIRTEAGKGTTFVMRLPVTLAIVRALIAGVGPERYALPLTYVAETVEFGVQATTIVEGRPAIRPPAVRSSCSKWVTGAAASWSTGCWGSRRSWSRDSTPLAARCRYSAARRSWATGCPR